MYSSCCQPGSMTPGGRAPYGIRHSHTGSVRSRDDESLANSPSMPNYMQATQSAKAKVRSHSTPRQRPGTPERKRFSLPMSPERLAMGSPGRIVLPRAPRSPSLRPDQRSVSSMGSRPGDATPATSEVSGLRTPLYR